jgi:mannose-6-phosphate isomerase-like protein (cupin superfamily)
MNAFDISQLLEERRDSGKLYLEFLRAPGLSLGVYSLKAGATDPQKPHAEDEVYYVLKGRGQIRVGDEDRTVRPGAVVFVAAHAPHKFHAITEDLDLLVFFAPAESVESGK